MLEFPPGVRAAEELDPNKNMKNINYQAFSGELLDIVWNGTMQVGTAKKDGYIAFAKYYGGYRPGPAKISDARSKIKDNWEIRYLNKGDKVEFGDLKNEHIVYWATEFLMD